MRVALASLVAGLSFLPAALASPAGWQRASASAYSVHDSGSSQGCPHTPRLTDGALTVATFVVPCGTRLRVCLGSRCVVVTRTDSGPFVAGRLFDLNAGVVHALIGSWSPAAWGVRTVRWRRA